MRSAKTKEQQENSKKLNNLFVKTAGSFAEHLITLGFANKMVSNVFGRSVRISNAASLSYLHGLAVSGIRCAAMVRVAHVETAIPAIKNMARQHVPMTILLTKGGMPHLPELAQTGAIVFQAFDAQTLADRILHAQVISEKALVPVVVMAEFDDVAEFTLPEKRALINFFGDPDSFSNVKSPAQGIVFGNKRKRVPNWTSLDNPIAVGVKKDDHAMAFETAAKKAFSASHLQEMIDETTAEFEKMTSRKLSAVVVDQPKRVDHALISTAQINRSVFVEEVSMKNRIATFEMHQLFPLPKADVNLSGMMTILESYSATQLGWYFKEWNLGETAANGWYDGYLNEFAWKALLNNLLAGAAMKKRFWVDVPFDVDRSAFPKHQVLVQHINRDYGQLNANSLIKANGKDGQGLPRIPENVKKYAEKGPSFSRVSRFYDDTACFYGDSDEMIADPYQAHPVMPVSTASFIPLKRGWAPEFHPQKSKDIESILKACPHGAMPASLLTIDAILKAGIAQARANGHVISPLVPQLKIWAKKAAELAVKKAKEITVMGDFLPESFEETIKIAKADDEKKKTIRQEYEAMIDYVKDIPVAITEKYFLSAEKKKPATGELFTLAVDPNSCTGCGTCAELCTDDGIQMNVNIDEIEELNLKRFNQVAALPSTSAATIKKLMMDKNFDSFAALMLDRDMYSAMTGGSMGDDFSAEKAVLRMISALAKRTLAANSADLEKNLSKQMAALNAAVKKLLSDSLPVTHLDTLMDVLQENHEEKLSMDRIMKEWGQSEAFKVIPREQLESKLELIEGLKEWKWALKEGFSGAGRANYSIVLDDSLDAFAQYPWNNFTVPVLVAGKGDTAQTARGAFEGQVRHAIDQIKLLRRTDLEAVGKYDPTVHDYQIAGLSWNELTEEERKMIPPVFVLGGQKLYKQLGDSQMIELLESGFPIKVIILDNLNPKPEQAAAVMAANANAYWNLLVAGKTQLSRVSLADANHMYTELEGLIGSMNSAVISVLVPNAFTHDINPQRWRQLSGLAVNTRGFNPFSYDPTREGSSFGTKFNTSILQDVDHEWLQVELEYEEDHEQLKVPYKPTWADWAFTLNSWKGQFKSREDKANTVLVSDYLELDAEARAKKIPVILRVDDENNLVRYEVGKAVIETTEVVLRNFRLMRELAGLYTEFPEQLKEQVTAELSKEFEIEKKKFTAELAKEKAEWEKAHLADIKEQMKARLMELAQQEL